MFGSWNPSQYKLLSASALLKLAKGFSALQGILCATSSSLVVQAWDTLTDNNDANAVAISGQLTLTAGQSYPLPAKVTQGLYLQVISGSGTFTVFFD